MENCDKSQFNFNFMKKFSAKFKSTGFIYRGFTSVYKIAYT